MPESRSEAMGIEKRTLINLKFVKETFDDAPDKDKAPVHIVTQIVNSLLGLLILPYSKGYALRDDPNKLEELYDHEWPRWDIADCTPNGTWTLGQLARHLRNAAAHGRYYFSSDSRQPREVTITVEDKPRGQPINWSASIRADKLYTFCQCLSDYMDKGRLD